MDAGIRPRRAVRSLGEVAVMVVGVLLGGAASVSAQNRTISVDDLRLLTEVGDMALAPDGTRAALIKAVRDYDQNRYAETLVLIDLATGVERELTPHRTGVTALRWSPDGTDLAFRSFAGQGEGQQVFVLPMVGGEARQVTRSPGGVVDFDWSADGASILYRARDPARVREGEEQHNRSFEVGDNSYLTRAAPRPVHLWRVALDGGDAERLTEGQESITGIRVSPDGRTVALGVNPSAHSGTRINAGIHFLDLETGIRRELGVTTPTFLRGFSPDGFWFAFGRPRGAEMGFHPNGIFLAPTDGGPIRDITAGIDRNLGGVEWLSDSRSMLVTGIDQTRRVMWHVPLDGTPERVELGGVHVLGKEATPDGRVLIVGAEAHRPSDLYLTEVGDWEVRRLTSYNDTVAEMRQGRVETVIWDGPDGFRQNGVLIYPPDYQEGRKYPLVLNIHGGPNSASIEQFDLQNQAMAARGWLVFSPNYRGSITQGQAFQSAVINDAGDGPGRDVMSGIDFLKAQGIVDEDRIAVSGWSYGGYLTAWLTAHYDGWAAAVAGAAVTDWFDWYNMADLNVWAGLGLRGSPWLNGNAENYWRQSPMAYADQMRTPTLILSTTDDERVTVSQSYKLYHALKDNGVHVQFIAYPVSGHFPSDPVHQRDVYRRWIDWIAERFDQAAPSGDANRP